MKYLLIDRNYSNDMLYVHGANLSTFYSTDNWYVKLTSFERRDIIYHNNHLYIEFSETIILHCCVAHWLYYAE